jgi:enoyl-CoA hydratase/carnithine racemase
LPGDLDKALRASPPRLIAAVDGVCAGAGAILAMASDIRIGTPDSRVAFLFTRVGLSGADMGACSMLPRIIGHGRAAELLYTGRFMAADEAERWGFYNRTVPSAALASAAHTLAAALAQGPSFAHGVTKACLHAEWDMSIDDAIAHEAQAQAVCMMTTDFERAYRAFVAKAPPHFQGN